MGSKSTILNFGQNVAFTPAEFYEPTSEDEVLEILRASRGKDVRVVGSLHAWSRAAACDQVVISLRYLAGVSFEERDGLPFVLVGGGCKIKHLLAELRRSGVTLPSLGLITEQTIAGACSTGTHGSGKHSLSHYLAEVRIANVDEEGNVRVETLDSGSELWAARCSLGSLGVILSVGVYCRPRYRIAEHWCRHDHLEEVLAMEEQHPLQQFFLIPWKWKYVAQHRCETSEPQSRLAWLYRIYFFVVIDVLLHLCVVMLTRILRARRLSRRFLQWIAPWCIITHWRVVDDSESMLVMEHELFRHIEIEMFVTRSRLAAAMNFVTALIKYASGDHHSCVLPEIDSLRDCNAWSEVEAVFGSYSHCYPVCIRRVLPDETLMSMSADCEEDVYAISLISYLAPKEREGFDQFARLVCDLMIERFEARPHWGKVCPIRKEQVQKLYPGLPEFQAIANRCDPSHQFRNAWMEETVFANPVLLNHELVR